jgi:hypothetical protein
MPWGLTLEQALRLTECLFALSLLIQTVEFLRLRAATDEHGLWSWSLQRRDIPSAMWRRMLDVLFTPWVHQLHLWMRLVAALALIVQGGSLGLMVFLFLGNVLILIRWRGAFNGGSDFLTLAVLTGLLVAYAVAAWGDTGLGMKAGLWYIGIQSVTSYFMSGAVKILQPEWRSGRAMTIFLNAAAPDGPSWGPGSSFFGSASFPWLWSTPLGHSRCARWLRCSTSWCSGSSV